MCILRRGQPGRHRSIHNLLAYGFGPRPSIVVTNQRHRSDFASPMAFDAPIVEDWGNILSEGNFGIGGAAPDGPHAAQSARHASGSAGSGPEASAELFHTVGTK